MSKTQDSDLCSVCGVAGEHDCRLEEFEAFVETDPRDWPVFRAARAAARAGRIADEDREFLRSIGVRTKHRS
jgi:hypothetical protein